MIQISGLEQLEEFLWEAKENNKISVVYFGAPWCGPCKKLKEKITNEETMAEMPNLSIGYVDVDETENEEISEKYNVSSIPTQLFLSLNGPKIVENFRIVGYDWTKFVMNYEELNKPKLKYE
jgi:thiol-disulfide isomerase/thioredoxin